MYSALVYIAGAEQGGIPVAYFALQLGIGPEVAQVVAGVRIVSAYRSD